MYEKLRRKFSMADPLPRKIPKNKAQQRHSEEVRRERAAAEMAWNDARRRANSGQIDRDYGGRHRKPTKGRHSK